MAWSNDSSNLMGLTLPILSHYTLTQREMSTQRWFKDGKLHRVGGPAVESWDPEGELMESSHYLYGSVVPATV